MNTTDADQSTVHDWPVGTLAEIEWAEPMGGTDIARSYGGYWSTVNGLHVASDRVTAVCPVKVVPVDAVVLDVETKSLLSEWHPRTLRHDAALLDDKDLLVTAIRLEVIADAIERAQAGAPELPSDPSGGVATPDQPVSVGSVDDKGRESALRKFRTALDDLTMPATSAGVASCQRDIILAAPTVLAELDRLTADVKRLTTSGMSVECTCGVPGTGSYEGPTEDCETHGAPRALLVTQRDEAREALYERLTAGPEQRQPDRDAAWAAVRKCSPWMKGREVERVVDAVFSTLGGQR